MTATPAYNTHAPLPPEVRAADQRERDIRELSHLVEYCRERAMPEAADALERTIRRERAIPQVLAMLRETRAVIIGLRDDLENSVTNPDGAIDDPADKAEVARLDHVIDRAEAVIDDMEAAS